MQETEIIPSLQSPTEEESAGERKVRRIQDRAFDFACQVILLYEQLIRNRGAGRTLASQFLRSGTSIGSNLEEAHAGQTRADFVAKCRISLKEARETHYWLRLFAATHAGPERLLIPMVSESNEIVAILTTIVRKATQTKSGSKEVE